MILQSQLTSVGKLFKPHGIKGELNAELDYDLVPDGLRCLILEIDGIFTPFFIESSRGKGTDRWLLKLEGVDDERQAAPLVNHEIYALTDELPFETGDDGEGEGVHLFDLIGFRLFDRDVEIGTVEDIDDATANLLLIVGTPQGKTVFVPFAEAFVDEISPADKTIVMDIPDGILDLNK